MRNARRNLSIAAVIISCISSQLVIATPIYTSSVRVLAGNPVNEPPAPLANYVVDVVPRRTTSSTNVVEDSGTVSFSGPDINGDLSTMQLHYAGKAQASVAGLKAASSITLTDPFFNAGNPPYVINSRFEVDPAGVPVTFVMLSSARFDDTLSVIGNPALSYLRAYLEFEGTTSPRTQAEAAFATLRRGDGSVLWQQDRFATVHGPSLLFVDFAVVGGAVDFSLSFDTAAQIRTRAMDWSGGASQPDQHSFIDFFNTISFDSFVGLDANHNPVQLISVTGSEGFAYRVASGPVDAPEPMSFALLGLGLAALSLAKKFQRLTQ